MRRSRPRSGSRLEAWEHCCAGRRTPCARRLIVRHLSDGILRRIYDEPLALTASDQAHYDTCAECKTRFQAIANTARVTTALLDLPAFTPEPAGALRSLRARLQQEGGARPRRRDARWRDRPTPRLPPLATPPHGPL